ncbi:MAG: hypothetical protein AB1566_12120 [Chloroflexota bacterium]
MFLALYLLIGAFFGILVLGNLWLSGKTSWLGACFVAAVVLVAWPVGLAFYILLGATGALLYRLRLLRE